jgi:hypothetical protein
MKNLITLLTFLIPVLGFSQLTTVNPDTVCYQTSGSIYQVPNTPGYTYNWVVSSPGTITNGQGTNQINVDWSTASPGTIVNGVSVTATDANGCTSDPVDLNIFIYQVLPSITTIGPFCEGEPCVTLNATPTGGVFSGNGVSGNQFCSGVAGVGTHTITYTLTINGCTFTTTSTVVVNQIPVLSPIEHN